MMRPSNDVLIEYFKKQSVLNEEAEIKTKEEWQKYQDEQSLGVRLAIKLDSILNGRGIRICEVSVAGIVGFFTRNVCYGVASGLFVYGVTGLTDIGLNIKTKPYHLKEEEMNQKLRQLHHRENIYKLMMGYLANKDATLSEIYPFTVFLDIRCADLVKSDDELSQDEYTSMVLNEMDRNLINHFKGKVGIAIASLMQAVSGQEDTIIDIPLEEATGEIDQPKTYQYRSSDIDS